MSRDLIYDTPCEEAIREDDLKKRKQNEINRPRSK